MIGMSIALKHDFLLIVHTDLFRYTDGRSIRWIDHRDEPFDVQGVERKIAYGASRRA